MNRIFLGLIATIVTVSILFSFVGCAKETPAEYFDYEKVGNHIIITGLVKTDLEKIVIPERIEGSFVTEIDGSAFNGCTSLTNVTIPDSITEIAYSAFEGCTSLKNVTIPDSVKEIDSYVFENCINFEWPFPSCFWCGNTVTMCMGHPVLIFTCVKMLFCFFHSNTGFGLRVSYLFLGINSKLSGCRGNY